MTVAIITTHSQQNNPWNRITCDRRHCRIAVGNVSESVVLQVKLPEQHHDSMFSAIVTSHLSASLEHAEARAHHDDSNIDVLKDNHENGSHEMPGPNINATLENTRNFHVIFPITSQTMAPTPARRYMRSMSRQDLCTCIAKGKLSSSND